MSEPSFQTVRLSRGRHVSPTEGACVMELASMLAGERFNDHPRSVCPAIAMVLRAYNDGIDDARRQDLYAYASAVVGTRDRATQRARIERLMEFFGHDGRPPRLIQRPRMRSLGRTAVSYAASADTRAHRAFLRLLDELTGESERDVAVTRSAAAASS